jgi:hypothetical protein
LAKVVAVNVKVTVTVTVDAAPAARAGRWMGSARAAELSRLIQKRELGARADAELGVGAREVVFDGA